MKLQIYWKPSFNTGREQVIEVMGVDLDPSGTIWYYKEDPNDRVEIPSISYYWARVVS